MTQHLDSNRRRFLTVTGVALASASLLGKAFGSPTVFGAPTGSEEVSRDGVQVERGGDKPVYLPEEGSRDVAAWSLAENLFWVDIMAEHALFMALMMPTEALTDLRNEALNFRTQFVERFAFLRTAEMSESTFANVNRETIEMTQPLLSFKRRVHEMQASGRIHTLAFPTLMTHILEEGEHFVKRLEMLSDGNVSLDRAHTIRFWSETMGEHSLFIAHMLDPVEGDLIAKARGFAERFERLSREQASLDAIIEATREIVEFKTVAGRGINDGSIKSMILPSLADHVRREAVRAHFELRFLRESSSL